MVWVFISLVDMVKSLACLYYLKSNNLNRGGAMKTLGNILWYFPFFGFLNGLFFFLIGSLLVLTVVGAPLGLGLIQYSKFLFAPFSWAMVPADDLNVEQNEVWKKFSLIIRIIWFPFGVIGVIVTVLQIIGLCITIVGIPVGLVLAKSISTIFNPVGKVCVAGAVAQEVQKRKDDAAIEKHLG